MNSLIELLTLQSTFTMLLAPPGWGKTSGLIDLLQLKDFKMVYLSPLNAINNEVFGRFSKIFSTYISKGELNDIYQKFLSHKKSVLISTPESLNIELLMKFYCQKKNQNSKDKINENNMIFVLDEVHLFYYWSSTFRPILLEKLIELSFTNLPILGITATLDQNTEVEWRSGFKNQYDHLVKINLGNQTLLNDPQKFYSFHLLGRKLLQKHLKKKIVNLKKNERILVFCKYRKQVDWWLDFCFYKGIWALGCKGGQADQFLTQLKKYPETQIIFTTSVLGHGVNLPSMKSVWILDEIKNVDFVLQMVARAGRSGEKYFVYNMEKGEHRLFKRLGHSIKLYFKIFFGLDCEN